MQIPITRDMNTGIESVVGFLEVPEAFADEIASGVQTGMVFKILPCAIVKDGKPKLHMVRLFLEAHQPPTMRFVMQGAEPPTAERLTREQVLEKLREYDHSGDTEMGHIHADDLIEEFLRSLGYADVADAYGKIKKWYS